MWNCSELIARYEPESQHVGAWYEFVGSLHYWRYQLRRRIVLVVAAGKLDRSSLLAARHVIRPIMLCHVLARRPGVYVAVLVRMITSLV